MIQRLTRIVSSFVVVLAMYWVYALAAVPFIEPTVAVSVVVKDDKDDKDLLDRKEARPFDKWFAEGEWERTSPKVLETAQGMLLVKNYQVLGEGRVQINPCTMIFVPEGNADNEEERMRRAIILRSPQGALLRFDTFDLKLGKVGKLIAGTLVGPVTIRSDQREVGPQDDLLIQTRDVDLTERELWTSRPVQFQIGPNYGQGRGMHIDMAPQGTKRGFRGMTLLELKENVEMHLVPGGNSPFPRGAAPVASDKRANNGPVEVRCHGPFRFDFVNNQATYTDQVEVLRVNPTGANDQLTADLLSVFFEAVAKTPINPAAPPDKSAPNLQPVRVEATGNPVTINVPTNDLRGRAQRLDYDIKAGGITLTSADEASIQQGGREIRSRELHYEPGPDGKIGQFIANGAGSMRGTSRDQKSQPFEAHWTQRLHLRPDQGIYLLTVLGNAHAGATGRGAINADEIHVWLKDAALEAPPPASPSKMGQVRQDLKPERMLATGHVTIDSPQLTGNVGQLQAWFEYMATELKPVTVQRPPLELAPPPATFEPSAPTGILLAQYVAPAPSQALPETVTAPPGSIAPNLPASPASEMIAAPPPASPIAPSVPQAPQAEAVPAPPPQPTQRFHVIGELLRLKIKMFGQQAQFSEAYVERDVRLSETQTRNPGEKPLLVMGQQLHLDMPNQQQAIVMVAGEPAYVEARGLTLTSTAIHLDRGRNFMWTDGQGAMNFPVDRDLDGRATGQPQTLDVSWRGQMQFDGLTARFEQGVVATHASQTMTTDQLEVLLVKRVEFGQAGDMHDRSQVDRVTCRKGVRLESRTLENLRLLAIDTLSAQELTIEQATGNVTGEGPGILTSVRFDTQGKSPKLAMPGAVPKPPPSAGPEVPPQAKGLTYLGINFQGGLQGNIRRHEMTFENQVRALYGPVATWESRLDPDRPESWGDNGVMLSTERLHVVEVATQPERRFELDATGRTIVENAGYTAHASRMTYSQDKDLLVFEGQGTNRARLYRQQRIGARPAESVAQKIMFWPKTNRVTVEGAQFSELETIPR